MRDGPVTLPEMDQGRPAVDDTAAGALFADVERRLFGSTDRAPTPKAIGRYRVTGLLGRGANGVVYRARDPALDRDVAVKVLRPDIDLPISSRDRMRREARALAALSHPNVVSLYDAGIEDKAVFVVMELVDGEELGHWLGKRHRSWRQIVAVFAQIADGLWAAHQRDIVHRDVKPANVLVDRSGRPRVADFGLASLTQALPAPEVAGAPAGRPVAHDITRTGLAVGTPAYMAPEQHESKHRLGKASDQFSFCVALWEALFGERPFRGRDWVDLIASKRRGAPPFPRHARLPSGVRRVLARGLSVDPAERFASMEDVAHALRRASARRSFSLAAAAGAALVAGGVGWFGVPSGDACKQAADEARRDWKKRSTAVQQAFDATELLYAADTFARVDPHLREWTAEWKETYAEACRADQDGNPDGGAAMHCLQGALADYGSIAKLLEAADPAFVRTAIQAVHGLQAPSDCAAAKMDGRHREPDPAYAAIRSRLRTAAELGSAGLLDEAGAVLREVRSDAASRGSVGAELALRLEEARLGLRRESSVAAADRLEAVVWDAVAAGSDHVAVDAMLLLADEILHGIDGLDLMEAERWLRAAEARLDDLADVEQRAYLWTTRASSAVRRGEIGAAREHAQAVIDLPEDELPHVSLFRTNALTTLARVAAATGNAGDAYRLQQEVVERSQQLLGPNHPTVGSDLLNLGAMAAGLGRWDEAHARYQDALAIFESLYPEGHPSLPTIYDNLGHGYLQAGRFDDAEQAYRRAHSVALRTLGPDHDRTAVAHSHVGHVIALRGDYDAAIAIYRDAEAVFARAGEDLSYRASNLTRLGSALEHLERLDEAEAAYTEAIELLEGHDLRVAELSGAWGGLGRVSALRDDWEASLVARQKVAELNRTRPLGAQALAAVNLAIAYEQLDRIDEARTQATEAVRLLGEPQTIQDDKVLDAAQDLLDRTR